MTTDENRINASSNFTKRLAENTYPGRGIVLGRTTARQWIQLYWIMGRSENSRNRTFVENNRILQTQAADPSKVQDPSLIIYNAMREVNHCFIVTNGVQTDVICEGLEQGRMFEESLLTQAHEPDAPNFTPRISGCIELQDTQVQVKLSLIKASLFDTNISEHHFFHYHMIGEGYGYAITTYQQDGKPLPSFQGRPFLVPLEGDAHQIANTYWAALNEDNRISLAVKTIDPSQGSQTRIINKYQSKES